ncbi:MAG: hypothetical protein DWQ02_22800 [Bacteroidetes bacterium]|nr:MAG: hypothetical protein DWQ02_22800 [Bacteroidota bacterium]
MERVSTNATLFYRLFLPIFWIVFFGAFTLSVFITNRELYGEIPGNYMRLGSAIFYITGLVVLYFTLMRLKRVEMDDQYVFVTNYIKHYRYPWHNIESIQEQNFLFLKLVTLTLKTPGSFGKKVVFAASHQLWAGFWKSNPELKEKVNFVEN